MIMVWGSEDRFVPHPRKQTEELDYWGEYQIVRFHPLPPICRDLGDSKHVYVLSAANNLVHDNVGLIRGTSIVQYTQCWQPQPRG